MKKSLLFGFIPLLCGCSLFSAFDRTDYRALCIDGLPTTNEWGSEQEVVIEDYAGSAMEPQISADGNIIFFNNKTDDDKQMDVHFAVRRPRTEVFMYGGIVKGADAAKALDGTPAVDRNNNFYFVSLRDYGKTYSTIYSGGPYISTESSLRLTQVQSIDEKVTRAKLMDVDMGVDVSWDGKDLFISRADFSFFKNYPNSSYMEWAHLNADHKAEPDAENNRYLKEINNPNCRVYAVSISNDKKELFYTVFPSGSDLNPGNFRILVSKRPDAHQVFPRGAIISSVKGQFTEAPSLSEHDGGRTLFYHRLDGVSGKYRIYRVTRK